VAFDYAVGLLAACALIGYLLFALVKPERF